MFRSTMLSLGVLCGLLPLFPAMAFAQRTGQGTEFTVGPVAFRSVDEVIVLWSPEQPLYIKGRIGVGQQQLAELRSWLAANAPHWTIVLMDRADDQAYTADDGRAYEGMDAVEHALGYGLSNQTAFGRLEHPVTKETDGAVFALFLQERKFSYFASDAQDRRGLGEANWIGELDQSAFRAMRGGGRIIDAVKDTVLTVNRRLERAIQAEADAARRAEAERQRSIDSLNASLATTRESIAEVHRESEALRQESPSASGPLAAPPLDQWRQKLDEVQSQLGREDSRNLEQRLSVVIDAIAHFQNALAARKGVDAQADKLRLHSDNLRVAQGGVARAAADEAAQLIQQAQQSAKDGNLDVAQLLARADEINRQGDATVDKERRRVEQARLRMLWIQRTALTMLAAFLLSLAVIGIVLNRRRRPSMARAKEQLAQREASVRKEIEDIDRLFARNGEILGSKERIVEHGYEGKTRDVGHQALDYVDDLFIMSKEIRRVLGEARELVYPTNLAGVLVNLFSGGRYQRAINHITGKPLKFSPGSGLPRVFENQASQPSAPEDGIQSAPAGETSMTFEEVFKAVKQRSDAAENALNTFENCLTNVHDSLSNLQKELQAAVAQESELQAASQRDGYFALSNYFSVLIPSVHADLAEADRLATFDAVQSMQVSIPAAKRKLEQSRTVANLFTKAREEMLPALHATAEKLRSLKYRSDWIDVELGRIASTANELMKTAATESIDSGIANLASNLSSLPARASTCAKLAERIGTELNPATASLESRIAETRRDLGERLRLSPNAVLRELERDPDDFLSGARKCLEAAATMLHQGHIEAANSAVEAAGVQSSRAAAILDQSSAAVQAFSERQRLADTKLSALRSRLPQIQKEVLSAGQTYAASALFVTDAPGGAPDEPSVGAAPATVEEAPERLARLPAARSLAQLSASVQSLEREAQVLLSQMTEEHRQGRVLQAAEMQTHAEQLTAQAVAELDLATAHLERLRNQTRANMDQQQRCEEQIRGLMDDQNDPLVSGATLADVEQLAAAIDQNSRDLSSPRAASNPFQSAKELAALRQRTEELRSRIIGDRQSHAEAARAAAGAQRQFDVARQLVRQSQEDGIADSQETTMVNERIAILGRELVALARDLQQPHGDWQNIDSRASRLQSDLSASAKTLSGELRAAGQALQTFQQASQIVFQAEKWSGAWGTRVLGSHGVDELERARQGLQVRNKNIVFEPRRRAAAAAQAAIQQAEREVARRRMEEQYAQEQARRAREAAARPRYDSPIGGGFSGGPRRPSPSPPSSSGSSNTSGFSRSGW